jgi:hypothetical protein
MMMQVDVAFRAFLCVTSSRLLTKRYSNVILLILAFDAQNWLEKASLGLYQHMIPPLPTRRRRNRNRGARFTVISPKFSQQQCTST